MEVGGLFAVPTWHLFIRRNPGFILFIMPSLGPTGTRPSHNPGENLVLLRPRFFSWVVTQEQTRGVPGGVFPGCVPGVSSPKFTLG